jgi:hypothetical protein
VPNANKETRIPTDSICTYVYTVLSILSSTEGNNSPDPFCRVKINVLGGFSLGVVGMLLTH